MLVTLAVNSDDPTPATSLSARKDRQQSSNLVNCLVYIAAELDPSSGLFEHCSSSHATAA